ncbi:hypothetical protein GBA52_006685 [Prunus armeniaca]|nr:hypothetical protein GBA52_006685 [Prunus armeniaca]
MSEVWFLTYFSSSSCLLDRNWLISRVGERFRNLGFDRFSGYYSGHFRPLFGVGPRTKVAPNGVLYLG